MTTSNFEWKIFYKNTLLGTVPYGIHEITSDSVIFEAIKNGIITTETNKTQLRFVLAEKE